jgi:hypothetical protein
MMFAQAVHVKRMIEGIAAEPKQTFWIMTTNLLMESAALEWSKVFGSRHEDTHWTQATPKAAHEHIRAAMLRHLGMQQAEWEQYRDSVVCYRDQMVAHHDLAASVATYPRFDSALAAANFMFEQVRALADQDWLGGIPTSMDRWAHTVASNMSAIVAKAFAASAELGPNVPKS